MNIKTSILRLHYNRNTIVIYMYYIRIIGKNFYQTPSHLLPQNLIFKPFLSSSIGCGCPTYLRRLKRCLKASVRTLAMLATPTALFGTVGRTVFFHQRIGVLCVHIFCARNPLDAFFIFRYTITRDTPSFLCVVVTFR